MPAVGTAVRVGCHCRGPGRLLPARAGAERAMITCRETRARLRADRRRLERHFETLPGPTPTLLWLHPAYQCVLLHRISHYCFARGHRLTARVFWHLNLLL